MGEQFCINIHGKEYIVTPNRDNSSNGVLNGKEKFKIETDCGYLFTINLNDEWFWEISDLNMKPIDDDLVQEIGEEIEHSINK